MTTSMTTRRLRWVTTGLGLALFGGAALAQSVPTTRPAKRVAAAKAKRPGKVRKAYGVRWQPSLDAALAQGVKKKRPVVWFRVLGELTGFT